MNPVFAAAGPRKGSLTARAGAGIVPGLNETDAGREGAAFRAGASSRRVLQRILIGSAVDLDLDSAGRILISPELRTAAGLEREVFLSGVGEHFELWDPARMEELEKKQLAEGGLDAADDFSV